MGAHAAVLPEAPEGLIIPPPLDILLVGGSGFLGSHAARGLLARGHRVSVLSRGTREPMAGTALLSADRGDPASMAAALNGRRFDLTVDFGLFDAPDLDWLAAVTARSLGRLVMISTGQVYLVGVGASPPHPEADEETPAMPEPAPGSGDQEAWRYGVGKRRAEQALRGARETHGIETVALRLPTVQGERDASLRLWAYLERMLDGGPLVLPEGGRRPVRFLDAGDLAEALERIGGATSLAHDAYNLASPDILTLRVFLERVAEVGGIGVRFVEASWDEVRAAGLDARFLPYAGHWASVLDPSRAKAELGIVCTRSEDYLPRIVRWHLEHRPQASHEGYAQRAVELELATRLVGAGR